MFGRITFALVLSLLGPLPRVLPAQTGRPYDGIDAGLDAFNLAEEQRRFKISQQRALNEELRARSYLPPGPVLFTPAGTYAGFSGFSSSYTSRTPLGFRRVEERVVVRSAAPAVLWPDRYFGINTYTFPFKAPLRQPIGQQQSQTGPNRWESHPVYANPPPRFPVTPPIANDPLELRGPPGAQPRRAVREF